MNNIKQKMSSDKGITIVSLLIAIILMIIFASISIGSSMDSIYDIKLKGFYSKLEMLQKRVDEVTSTNESYIDENGNTIYIKNMGISYENLDESKQSSLSYILNYEGLNIQPNNFRYFTSDEVNTIFDLSEIEYDVFIDFDKKIVLAEDGIEINGQMYYASETSMYTPLYNEEAKPTLNSEIPISYTIIEYGTDKYKLTIIPNYNVEEYKPTASEIKYKKTTSKYWETSTNLEMIIDELSDYDIVYEDSNKNSVTKKIKVWIDDNDNLTVTEITEEDN